MVNHQFLSIGGGNPSIFSQIEDIIGVLLAVGVLFLDKIPPPAVFLDENHLLVVIFRWKPPVGGYFLLVVWILNK